MSKTLLQLQNEYLSFRFNEDATGELHDKKSGVVWRMGPVAIQEYGPIVAPQDAIFYRTVRAYSEGYPGRFKGRCEGDHLRFTVLGRLNQERGCFNCRVTLDGPWLEFRIDEIDAGLPSLVFPPAFESESLVIPTGAGKWLRKPYPGRIFHSAFGDLNMRFFGGLRGDNGWLAVFSEGHTDAGAYVIEHAVSPGWLKSLGRWQGPRAVRFRCTSGGYCGIAKAYRQWAIGHGLHRSLKEKIEATPALSSLIGGRVLSMSQSRTHHPEVYEDFCKPIPEDVRPYLNKVRVSFTHKQSATVVREARELGMARGLVNVRGWIRGGYDESHPDIWPPEPALGSIEELRNLLDVKPLIGCLHDNYQDIYEQNPSFPKGVIRLPDGQAAFGGLWAGGQAYLLCSREGLAYARRNWKQIQTLNPSGFFSDTTTASPLYECYDAEHPTSRAEDERYKLELLNFFKAQGLVVGNEEGRDFAVPAVDFYECRHTRSPGETIPLWYLVFHDAMVNVRYFDAMAEDASGTPNIVTDMLWGCGIHWGVKDPSDWALRREEFKASLAADAWHARIGCDEMVRHAFVSADGCVERTEFSSGLAIVANYSDEEWSVEGVSVPGNECRVVD
jgi:hypothetical protein